MSDIDDILRQEGVPVENEAQPAIWPRPAPVAHLKATQFQPGQSGNPSGKPSTYTLTRALREQLTIKRAEQLAQAALEQAEAGNLRALEFVRDSIEGKPGVRLSDNEWDPASAAVFQAMMALRAQSLVGQPQDDTDAG